MKQDELAGSRDALSTRGFFLRFFGRCTGTHRGYRDHARKWAPDDRLNREALGRPGRWVLVRLLDSSGAVDSNRRAPS